MDSGYVAGMWAELQNSNKVPRSLSTCESEVRELMRAIDSMVYAKKKEWEREKRELEAKLSVRSQELRITQSTLEQRHQEVGQLKSRLEVSERLTKDTAATYEEQLTMLRDEVMTMKRDYERMHRQYCKQVKELKKGKEKDTAELEELRTQTARDQVKLEDYKSRSREWEQDKRNSQRLIESLQTQVNALQHKLDLTVHQSQTFQSELTRHRDLLDSTESQLQRQVEDLRQQLEAARDTNNSQETQILRLKSAADTAMGSQKKLLADKVELEATVTRLQQRIKRLEDDLHKMRGDGERANRSSEEMVESLTQQLANAKITIREYAANKESADKQVSDVETKRLNDELAVAAAELKKRKKKEEKLQVQVTELQAELAASQQQYNNLVNNMSAKVGDLAKQRSVEVEVMNAQLSKLKEDLLLAESQRVAETEEMQATIDRLTAELVQQRGAVAVAGDKALAAEGKMHDVVEQLNRKIAEVQLESARVENRHLRRLHSSAQRHHSELSQLHELEKSFQSSLNHVEDRNDHLEQELQSLRRQLVETEEHAQDREEELRADAESQVLRVREDEARKVKEAEERGRKLAREMEERLSSTISDYETHVDTLRGQLNRMENELQSHDHSMIMLGMENDAMTQFVDGIDQIVKSTPMNSAERNRPTDAQPLPNAMGDASSESPSLQQKLETLHQQELIDIERTIDACIDEFDKAVANPYAEFSS